MKHKPVKAHQLQKNPDKKNCPRCGEGTYLAKHKDRLSCGKCHFTEFLSKK